MTSFIRHFGLCVAIPLALCFAVNSAEKPNVLIVFTDDQGYGDLACYGNEKNKTPRLDQLAAEAIGHRTRYPSLNFSTSPAYSCSYNRHGVALPPETSPALAFAKLFINGTKEEMAEEIARVQEGQSILDRVGDEARRLRGAVGPVDRDKLDQYFSSVRELEKRLERSEDYVSRPKPEVDADPIQDPGPGEDIIRFGLLLEVARLAMQTDLTRLVTMYYVGSSKTPSKPGESFAYHNLSHHGQDAEKIEQLSVLERDLLRQWGAYLGRMRETDGLMDHTFSVLGAAMGNASSHSATNLPLIVSGGGMRHGQHLAHDANSPPPLCNLWVSALQHLGLETDQFGSGTGSLTGLGWSFAARARSPRSP